MLVEERKQFDEERRCSGQSVVIVRLIEIKRRFTWWDQCVATYVAVYLYKSIVIRDSDQSTVGRCYPSEHDRDDFLGADRRIAWSFGSSWNLFPCGKHGIGLVPATKHGKFGGERDASVEADRRQALPITRRTESTGKVSSACQAARDKKSGGKAYSRIGVAEISAITPRDPSRRLNDAICEFVEVIRQIVNLIE